MHQRHFKNKLKLFVNKFRSYVLKHLNHQAERMYKKQFR